MEYAREIQDLNFGPTSMTMASLTDHMFESKRTIIQLPDPPLEYHTVYFVADELSAAMAQYDPELVAGLTTFFDGVPYSQARRTKELRIKIPKPQLNMLIGTTPSNLIKTLPETAWEQGFTSRTLMIYSEDRPIIDVFNTEAKPLNKDMVHDLKAINTLVGQFGWTEEYATAMHNWKVLGFTPVPNHPKLAHYCSRRFSHLIKLSMVANVDRGTDLCLTKADFNRAMGWLLEAEQTMVNIFQTGSSNTDSSAMDEILHFVEAFGEQGISEYKVVRFAKDFMPLHSVIRVVEVMEKSGMIYADGRQDRTGSRIMQVVPKDIN